VKSQIRPAVLLVNHQISGSERRYARFFIAAARMGADIFLFINPALYELEIAAGIPVDRCQNVIRLPARANRLLCGGQPLPIAAPHTARERRFNRRLALARKIDFALNVSDAWRLARRLRITHVHAVVGGIFVGLRFFLARCSKTVISVPAVDLRTMAARQTLGLPLLLNLLTWLLRRCDAVDAVSPAVKENLVRHGVRPERVHVAPCTFTDCDHFAPAAEKKDWVVFAGRFVETKNPLLFVQAIPEICRAHPQIRFLMFGGGPLQEDVEREIARLKVSNVVSVRYEADLAPWLAQSKVFVSVQVDENYSSQALLEAMACGNAIVASDVGETYRWVDEEAGARIQSTPDALASAIIALFEHPELLERKGKKARERASQEHTVEQFARYLLDVYAKLM
jgi:glycosyltransferase involved in cell wall biosynthesis